MSSLAIDKAAYQYQQNSIYNASSGELTLMLYNGAIKAIRLSQMWIDEKNYEKANFYAGKAQAIIQELRNSLDMQYDISKNLYELYDYFLRRLIQANIKKDKEIFQEVLHFVEELRDTWVQVLEITKNEKLNNMNK